MVASTRPLSTIPPAEVSRTDTKWRRDFVGARRERDGLGLFFLLDDASWGRLSPVPGELSREREAPFELSLVVSLFECSPRWCG